DCQSVFTFPDDEKLIQQEFAKNVPFALSVAEPMCRSPVSSRSRTSPASPATNRLPYPPVKIADRQPSPLTGKAGENHSTETDEDGRVTERVSPAVPTSCQLTAPAVGQGKKSGA
ncbi:hypothetical protein ABZ703_40585, partial [Streptomyces massasporeus]|uniref:hypothetical protein n=1 Tax=Streptomyces massasporeus TaxID=67324 RepID=UPI0033F5053A